MSGLMVAIRRLMKRSVEEMNHTVLLNELASALEEQGITARIDQPDGLTAIGPTPETENDGSRSVAQLGLSPRPLKQPVAVRANGKEWWWWLWPGPERGTVEPEPILPAPRIAEVARRISNVIGLRTSD